MVAMLPEPDAFLADVTETLVEKCIQVAQQEQKPVLHHHASWMISSYVLKYRNGFWAIWCLRAGRPLVRYFNVIERVDAGEEFTRPAALLPMTQNSAALDQSDNDVRTGRGASAGILCR